MILPGSVTSSFDRLKRWMLGYPHIQAIYSEAVNKKLHEFVVRTNAIKQGIAREQNGVTFDNILLSGPPGTGKTLWLDSFAAQTKMRIVKITAGSIMMQPGAGIKALDGLIRLAKSGTPLIIAIDEFDALARARDSIIPGSDHEKFFNHFLTLTSTGSPHFMILATTNRPSSLDTAMISRFQHHIEVELPDRDARLRQNKLFCRELILRREQDRGKKFVESAKALLNQETIEKLADTTESLSGSEIRDTIATAYKKTLEKNSELTSDHIALSLKECFVKRKSFTA